MSKDGPPLSTSDEAIRLRMAATEWGKNIDREPTDDNDVWSKKLNKELLSAALAYANAVYHSQRVVKHEDKAPGDPVRWMCVLCKRDNFTRRCGHKCVGGFRKRHLKWIPIYATPKEPDDHGDRKTAAAAGT